MSLNIKNERVHELARRAAHLTGRSQTSVIEEALERYVASFESPDPEAVRQARLDAVFLDIDVNTTDAERAATRAAEVGLYDESGLPA